MVHKSVGKVLSQRKQTASSRRAARIVVDMSCTSFKLKCIENEEETAKLEFI